MAQQWTTLAACAVELHKHGDANDSDSDTPSRKSTACSRSPSERSGSSGSQTRFARRFAWADADSSDDDADVMPSSNGSSKQNLPGNMRIPPGCNQPFQLGGLQPSTPCVPPAHNQHFSQLFVPVVCFVQPLQGQLPGVGQPSDVSPVNPSAQALADRRPDSPAFRDASHLSKTGKAAGQHCEALAGPGGTSKSKAATEPLAPEHDSRTMLVIQSLPAGCRQGGLRRILDEAGLAASYNFLYVPINLKGFAPLGYAFVNFESNEGAVKAIAALDGFLGCKVSWSDTQQDLQAHIERYRNSPLMHDSVPEEYRPALLKNGVRIPFPAPTQKLKAPKFRPAHHA